jgi:hypothetical protein
VVASSYVEVGDGVRVGDRWGKACSGRALAMPWWGRWSCSAALSV